MIKQWQDLRGLTAILKEVLLLVKFYQTPLYAAEKSFLKESVNHCLVLRNRYSHPSLQATTNTNLISQLPSTLRQDPPPAERLPNDGTFLVVQWLRLRAPNAGGPGSILVKRTRSHMPQLRVLMLQWRPSTLQLKPGTARYINKYSKGKKRITIWWRLRRWLAFFSNKVIFN